jgi:hypothetical protein
MTTPVWPGISGAPALPSRNQWDRKSVQLPFATDAGETDAPEIFWGTTSPDGAIAGSPGDLYLQTSTTGTGISVWQKLVGAGTLTGWFRSDRGAFNLKAFGATGDGNASDTTAMTNWLAAASAAAVVDATPAHVTGAVLAYMPPGKYKTTALATLSASGVRIVGAGSGATTIIPSHGGDALAVDGGSTYLRHVAVEGLSVDYTGITVTSGTVGIKINKCTDTCGMTDVQVVFPQANTVTNLVGLKIVDSESWSFRDVWVGWLRGVGSIGVFFDNAGNNRGNMTFDNVLVRDAYIGWKNVGSNVTNGLVFNSFKVINSASGAAVIPLYGIWVAGQTYGMSFNDPHIEGQIGGSFNFTSGIFLDATGTAIRNVKINNAMIERVTSGIDAASAGGAVQHCRIMDVRFLATETVTNGIVVGAGVVDSWFFGLSAQPTVTNWLVDSSAANSGNLFQWNLGGGASGHPLYYKGALTLQDGAAAPGTYVGKAGIHIDVAEGPLKIKSGTGVVRTQSQTQFADGNKTTTSTSDASITSYTLPAGVLAVNFQAIHITARGRMSTQNGSFNVKFGGTVIATVVPLAGENWSFDAVIVRLSGATQTANAITSHNGTGADAVVFPSETLANAIVIDFRGSVTSGGTLRLDYAAVEIQ